MKKNTFTQLFLIAMCLLFMGLVSSCDTDFELPTPTATTPPVTVNPPSTGDCCADCICRSDDVQPSSSRGRYSVQNYSLPRNATPSSTTVYYPTNAEPPLAGLVFCPPFTGVQSMFAAWGPFFASHGIIMVTMNTRTTGDQVDQRDDQQWQVVEALKAENSRSGSPLNGKVAVNRIGVTGWSMGGGATWINAETKTPRTAMSLAGHNATAGSTSKGRGIKCPTLAMCGANDTGILGGMGQSQGVIRNIPAGVPKILYEVRGVGHMTWGSPTQPGRPAAELSLAFQKTYLEGDVRWKKFLVKPDNASEWSAELY